MLSLSSYHTAIIQTGAAMFSIAAPTASPAFVPMAEVRQAPCRVAFRAMNDNVVEPVRSNNAVSNRVGQRQSLDEAHNRALLTALLDSSVEISGPIILD